MEHTCSNADSNGNSNANPKEVLLQKHIQLHHGALKKSISEIFEETLGQSPHHLGYDLDDENQLLLVYAKSESDPADAFVSEANGIIFDLTNYEIVAMGMYNMQRVEPSAMHIHADENQGWDLQLAIDGPVMKLWYFERKSRWMLSSRRRIRAWHGRFGQDVPSYGEILQKAISPDKKIVDTLNEKLVKTLVYTVILQHGAITQLVDRTWKSRCTIVSIRCTKCLAEMRPWDLACTDIFEQPYRIPFDKGRQYIDLMQKYLTQWRPIRYRGLVMTAPTSYGYQRFWCDAAEFNQALPLRGNWPTIERAYLAMNHPEQRHDFRQLFPRRRTRFDAIDRNMSRVQHRLQFLMTPRDSTFDGNPACHKGERDILEQFMGFVAQGAVEVPDAWRDLTLQQKITMIGAKQWQNVIKMRCVSETR